MIVNFFGNFCRMIVMLLSKTYASTFKAKKNVCFAC